VPGIAKPRRSAQEDDGDSPRPVAPRRGCSAAAPARERMFPFRGGGETPSRSQEEAPMCWTREEQEQFLERELADEREPVRVDEDAAVRVEEPVLEREDERELVHV
jgi:hypothetical protein